MTCALLFLTLLAAVLPLGVAWVGKRIVDAVVLRDVAATTHAVLLELGLVATQATVARGLGLVRTVLGARLGVDINLAILEKAVGLELRHFEDADFYDSLTRARREASSRPLGVVTDGFQLLQNVITLAGYGVLLVRFSGWAVVALLVATVPATVAEMRFSKLAFRLRNWRSPESRRLLYLEYVLANDDHAKEMKLFGLGPLFLGRYATLAEQFYDEDRRLAARRTVLTHALSLLATGAFYGAYVVMALGAARGHITLGDLTLYVLAFRQGQQAFQALLGAIGSLYEHNLYMSNLFAFLRGEGKLAHLSSPPAPPPPPQPSPTQATEARAEEGVRFENVGFRYAPSGGASDEGRWALRGVDVFIPKGQSVALVGENGAGKTTFVKLMTRLYTPTEGRILLDGRDLREWDEATLRRRFGVVFQDFNKYQLTFGENVGLGSLPHLTDRDRVLRATEQGGAGDVVTTLRGGLDAPLGRWFQDGTELSGGQWQKVALARAFMRDDADMLILDEPTAALDAHAEHAVFERFRRLAAGRTTVVISHRFPAVRMAERIFVLEAGRIVEEGSHAELVALRRRYARMFALQAEGYA
jgi:ATP-binding cassette subfamily B protein